MLRILPARDCAAHATLRQQPRVTATAWNGPFRPWRTASGPTGRPTTPAGTWDRGTDGQTGGRRGSPAHWRTARRAAKFPTSVRGAGLSVRDGLSRSVISCERSGEDSAQTASNWIQPAVRCWRRGESAAAVEQATEGVVARPPARRRRRAPVRVARGRRTAPSQLTRDLARGGCGQIASRRRPRQARMAERARRLKRTLLWGCLGLLPGRPVDNRSASPPPPPPRRACRSGQRARRRRSSARIDRAPRTTRVSPLLRSGGGSLKVSPLLRLRGGSMKVSPLLGSGEAV